MASPRSLPLILCAALCFASLVGCSSHGAQYSDQPPTGPQKSPATMQNMGPIRDASGKVVGVRSPDGVVHAISKGQ